MACPSHVSLEHFNFEMQPLSMTMRPAVCLWTVARAPSEGHDILSYAPPLNSAAMASSASGVLHAASSHAVRAHGHARITRCRARLREAKRLHQIRRDAPPPMSITTTLNLTGRNLHNRALPPTDTYRMMFPRR